MYTEALISKVRYWRMFWVGLSALGEEGEGVDVFSFCAVSIPEIITGW